MEPVIYIVKMIDGDYAHLVTVDTNQEILVARALLPMEIEEGTKLKSFMMEYEIID